MGRRVVGIAGALVAGIVGTGAAAAQAQPLAVHVVSTRADLVSGGDALAAIDRPAGTAPAVRLNGRDISAQFANRPDGRFEGLVTGLRNGANTLTASLPDGRTASATVVNHPIGGPTFPGPPGPPRGRPQGAKGR